MIILDEIQKRKDSTDKFIIFDEYQEEAFVGTLIHYFHNI